MAETKTIKTALISVFHKDGLEELLKKLNAEGVKFLSTGGTQTFIESLGYACEKVENVTTYPSILGDKGSTVVPTRDALNMAHDQGVDLVEISPNANPPVCRLIDYSKFLYQQKKRQKEMKAKQVKVEVKEIRFGPQTDEHDYQFKLKHAKEFLSEGNKVRAYVFFRGRSILFKEQGEVLLLRFANDLEEVGKVEGMPSLEGKKMFLYLAPKKAGEKKKSQQARDREAAEAEVKEQKRAQQAAKPEVDAEVPANGGLFANAKISADALKKLTEDAED